MHALQRISQLPPKTSLVMAVSCAVVFLSDVSTFVFSELTTIKTADFVCIAQIVTEELAITKDAEVHSKASTLLVQPIVYQIGRDPSPVVHTVPTLNIVPPETSYRYQDT